MSAGFTPGPWRLEPRDGCTGFRLSDEDDGLIDFLSSTNYIDERDDPEQEANCRLIAAAPELYEALEAVTTFAAATIEKLKLVDTNGIIDAANTALAKARGEQVSA